jgi:hypothetical protein
MSTSPISNQAFYPALTSNGSPNENPNTWAYVGVDVGLFAITAAGTALYLNGSSKGRKTEPDRISFPSRKPCTSQNQTIPSTIDSSGARLHFSDYSGQAKQGEEGDATFAKWSADFSRRREESDAVYANLMEKLNKLGQDLKNSGDDIKKSRETFEKDLKASRASMLAKIDEIAKKHSSVLPPESPTLSPARHNTGKIYYIRQTHAFTFTDACPELKNTGLEGAARSQQSALDFFISKDAELILPESHTEDYLEADKRLMKIGTEQWFSHYKKGQELDKMQQQALYDFGAHNIYKYLPSRNVGNVVFRPSSTSAIQEKAVATVNDHLSKYDARTGWPKDEYFNSFPNALDFQDQRDEDEKKYERYVLSDRNDACVNGILKAMQQYPGKDVFVLMGASERHNIPQLLNDKEPKLEVIEHDTRASLHTGRL